MRTSAVSPSTHSANMRTYRIMEINASMERVSKHVEHEVGPLLLSFECLEPVRQHLIKLQAPGSSPDPPPCPLSGEDREFHSTPPGPTPLWE